MDQHGTVLDIRAQRRRNMAAAKKFFRKLLKGCTYAPRVLIIDKLPSSGAARREILPSTEHRQSAISTTALKMRINPRANVRGSCSASRRLGTYNASCLLLARSV